MCNFGIMLVMGNDTGQVHSYSAMLIGCHVPSV